MPKLTWGEEPVKSTVTSSPLTWTVQWMQMRSSKPSAITSPS